MILFSLLFLSLPFDASKKNENNNKIVKKDNLIQKIVQSQSKLFQRNKKEGEEGGTERDLTHSKPAGRGKRGGSR